jgi:hypothetical protein
MIMRRLHRTSVMAGLVPAIHANTDRAGSGGGGGAFFGANGVRVDARVKPGHDAWRDVPAVNPWQPEP